MRRHLGLLSLLLFLTSCTGKGGFSSAALTGEVTSPSESVPSNGGSPGDSAPVSSAPEEPPVPLNGDAPPAGKVSMAFDQRFFDPEANGWKSISDVSELNLGDVPANSTEELKITLNVRNATAADVNVTAVRVPAGFVVGSFTPGPVPAGGELSFDVSLDKTSVGERRGDVELVSSGGTLKVKIVGVVR